MENSALITQHIQNWALAVRDRDIAAIMAHHADQIVMYDVPPPFQSVGLEAYCQTWDNFFTGTQPGIFDIGDLQVKAGDEIAFAYASMKCSVKSDNGEFEELPFRLTIGLEKINGQWLIVHEHHSIPAS
jgi:ketosteroid isomerase-like protein